MTRRTRRHYKNTACPHSACIRPKSSKLYQIRSIRTGSTSGAFPATKGPAMITLQLAQHRKARVWLTELPDARVNPSNVREHSVQTGHAVFEGMRRAAIEILIPRGPRGLYGLLGAELRPSRSKALV